MPTFATVIGQTKTAEFLAEAIRANKLSHALLFLGPAGTGRTTLALAVLSALNCPEFKKLGDSDGACLSCRQIDSRNFLYLKFVKPVTAEIKVDQIREMGSNVSLKLPENVSQMVIIEPAERLNPSSSNALLKALEEPPQHTYFVLIAENELKLLPTIRSRCQKIYLEPPRGEALEKLLRLRGRSEKESEVLGNMSKASIHLGLSKSSRFIMEGWPKILEVLDSLVTGAIDPLFAASSLVSLSAQGEDAQEVVELIKSVFRDASVLKTTTEVERIGNSDGLTFIKRIAARANEADLDNCFTAASGAQRAIEGHGNPLLVFEELMIKISKYLRTENKNAS